MCKPSFTERCRRVLSSVLWIAAATLIAVGLSAGTASADQDHKIEICHNGQTISVDVHAVPAHLEHGDVPLPCGSPPPCACGLNFDPVTCDDGKTYVNLCVARCAGAEPCRRVGVCSNIFDPVRCQLPDGSFRIFANECQAALAGAGNCGAPLCPCGLIYAPVRCADGTIYINACVASCQGASGCAPL
jgi:hypothetical protein